MKIKYVSQDLSIFGCLSSLLSQFLWTPVKCYLSGTQKQVAYPTMLGVINGTRQCVKLFVGFMFQYKLFHFGSQPRQWAIYYVLLYLRCVVLRVFKCDVSDNHEKCCVYVCN